MKIDEAYIIADRMIKDDDGLNLLDEEKEALAALIASSKIAERLMARFDRLEAKLTPAAQAPPRPERPTYGEGKNPAE